MATGKEETISPEASIIDIRDRILTLATINILEPVTKGSLVKEMAQYIDKKQIVDIIGELLSDGLIVKEKKSYRVTYRGSKFNTSLEARKLRDVQRMKYLLSISKQRGGV